MHLVWLFASVAFYTAGEYLSKRWASTPSPLLLGVTSLIYIGAMGTWLLALRLKNQLGVMGTSANALLVVTTLILGLVVFKETISTCQVVGIGFAIVAIILMQL